jgi:hypothetical protein
MGRRRFLGEKNVGKIIFLNFFLNIFLMIDFLNSGMFFQIEKATESFSL